jgi:hypothetical protein
LATASGEGRKNTDARMNSWEFLSAPCKSTNHAAALETGKRLVDRRPWTDIGKFSKQLSYR